MERLHTGGRLRNFRWAGVRRHGILGLRSSEAAAAKYRRNPPFRPQFLSSRWVDRLILPDTAPTQLLSSFGNPGFAKNQFLFQVRSSKVPFIGES